MDVAYRTGSSDFADCEAEEAKEAAASAKQREEDTLAFATKMRALFLPNVCDQFFALIDVYRGNSCTVKKMCSDADSLFKQFGQGNKDLGQELERFFPQPLGEEESEAQSKTEAERLHGELKRIWKAMGRGVVRGPPPEAQAVEGQGTARQQRRARFRDATAFERWADTRMDQSPYDVRRRAMQRAFSAIGSNYDRMRAAWGAEDYEKRERAWEEWREREAERETRSGIAEVGSGSGGEGAISVGEVQREIERVVTGATEVESAGEGAVSGMGTIEMTETAMGLLSFATSGSGSGSTAAPGDGVLYEYDTGLARMTVDGRAEME